MNQGNVNYPPIAPFYYFNQNPYGQMAFPGMPNFIPNPSMGGFQQQSGYDMKNMKNNSEDGTQGFYTGYNYFNKQA